MKKLSRITLATLACASIAGCGTYQHENSQYARHAAKIPAQVTQLAQEEVMPLEVTHSNQSKIDFTTSVLFAFDSDNLNAEVKPELDALANYLADNPGTKLHIDGFTDARGRQSYNMALGLRRAKSVADYLAANGVDESQIEVRSFGSQRLAMNDASDEAHAANRRVQIYLDTDEEIVLG